MRDGGKRRRRKTVREINRNNSLLERERGGRER